ncbi:MAG: hypothetical protein HON23_02230 [Rickettsiales bacterium]|jgi:hypothetical protein|nr:hypothetical protein [Rickettsiales bacterium]
MSTQDNTTSEHNAMSEYSVTDILQAHDILISVLVGKMIGITKNPRQMVGIIREMVDMQDVDNNVKSYVNLLLSPVEEALADEAK